ncbi:class I SAM-dependent methyltransferase [Olivibacter sitiensis]|uniref:class I SAM-dependent methyltransferase n=1 Tax=Olivibacter sitiensis TaxID=376470 RepID=UPI000401BC0F|nr:class I SAM-dependent methyltransferase [Olivibacter sitiensis]
MKRYYSYFSLFSPRKLRSFLSFGVKGYLAEIGWIEAYDKKKPIDIEGKPLPWLTYSAIDFLDERLNAQMSLFEYGSGSSTRYFASKVQHVTSVEHDQQWFEQVSKDLPKNVDLTFQIIDTDGKYCRTCLGGTYDIILIDGRDRNNCCKQAIQSLNAGGVIIFDDTERTKYNESTTFLNENGFRKLSFSGISPGFFYRKETSVFYRPNNCLGI